MWGGIMAVAVSFDLLATLFWKTESWSLPSTAVLGFFAAALAAPLFIVWVLWIVPEPYWAEGGLPRVLNYLWTRGVPSALFSVISAPVGFLLAGWIRKVNLAGSPSRIQ
jgi:Na+/proline symporter